MELMLTYISHLSILTKLRHLTKEKLVVLLATSSPKADNDDLTYYHFDSKIHTRIKSQNDDDLLMVPLTSLVVTCYIIVNKKYRDSNAVDDIYTDDIASDIVYRMNK